MLAGRAHSIAPGLRRCQHLKTVRLVSEAVQPSWDFIVALVHALFSEGRRESLVLELDWVSASLPLKTETNRTIAEGVERLVSRGLVELPALRAAASTL